MRTTGCNYFLFNVINLIYLISGIGLVVAGILFLSDTEKILISRLIPVQSDQPLMYYLCLGLLLLGLAVVIFSSIGCWAVHKNNYCFLSIYLFAILIQIIGESVIGIVTAICPQYLGLTLDDEHITDFWQRNYGVPGKEHYTAAIDLFQIKMECCGIHGANDYSTSWWRLRDLAAPNLIVPLSCCFINKELTQSFLDPIPLNTSLCQDVSSEKYHLARHSEGCLTMIEKWIADQIYIVLLAAIAKLALQLFLLFAVILSCSKEHIPRATYISSGKKAYR